MSALREAARLMGGVSSLCSYLGRVRQSFYMWEEQGGMPPIPALRTSIRTGISAEELCAVRHREELAELLSLAREFGQ